MAEPNKFLQKENDSDQEESWKLEKNIKIHPLQDGVLKAEILIPFELMSDNDLPRILRAAKLIISRQNKIPVGLLSYQNLVQKEVKSEGYQVTANIIQGEAARNKPVLRFMKTSSNEIEYNDILLYLDIYPLKESGEELSLDDVVGLLMKEKIEIDKIDFKAVENAMQVMQKDLIPVKNILLTQGRFPDPSLDAKIEYFLDFNRAADGSLIANCKVEPEQMLIRVTPSQKGEKAGYTARWETIPPIEPKSISIITGKGVSVSPNQTEVFAGEIGVPRLRISKAVDNPLMETITVSVEVVEVMDGSQPLNIATEKHMEIVGGLKSGSKLISKGEVIVSGDIEDNTSIIASGNITVSGKIKGGVLDSDSDIYSESDVTSSRLTAHGKLTIKGTTENSELVGSEVYSQRVVGCKLTAGTKVVVETVSTDERGFSAKITAGLVNLLQEKIKENQEFIDFASKNLNRFQKVVGDEIVRKATPSNVSLMIIIHTIKLKKEGIYKIPKKHTDALKELIGTIGPIRDLMLEKGIAIRKFIIQLKNGEQGEPEIVITGGVDSTVEVEITGVSGKINPSDMAVLVKNVGGEIVKEKLSKP